MGRGIAVVGENVADAVVKGDAAGGEPLTMQVHAGGGPANTAIALGRLGTPTRFVARIPSGPLGDLFRRRLAAAGVDVSLSADADEPATLAIAAIDDDGNADYQFYAAGTADWHWRNTELRPSEFRGVRCVHTGSLALVMPPGGSVIEGLLDGCRGDVTISIDPNVRPKFVDLHVYRSRLRRWCELADVIRVSRDDLAALLPGASIDQAFSAWHQAGVPLVIVTLGAEGAIASFNGDRVSTSAVHVPVADTIGAGDAFTGGVLHRLHAAGNLGGRLDRLRRDDLEAALVFGTHVAAATCAVPGANPPHLAELSGTASAQLPSVAG